MKITVKGDSVIKPLGARAYAGFQSRYDGANIGDYLWLL